MSYFFRYNKLIEGGEKGKEADKNIIIGIGASEVSNMKLPPHDIQYTTTDSQTLTLSTLTTNLEQKMQY